MKTKTNLVLAFVCALALATNAQQPEEVTTDTGTMDKETAAKAFPAKLPYSPYAEPQFSHAPVLRRHPSAHFALL